jgi:hypothetical protein
MSHQTVKEHKTNYEEKNTTLCKMSNRKKRDTHIQVTESDTMTLGVLKNDTYFEMT